VVIRFLAIRGARVDRNVAVVTNALVPIAVIPIAVTRCVAIRTVVGLAATGVAQNAVQNGVIPNEVVQSEVRDVAQGVLIRCAAPLIVVTPNVVTQAATDDFHEVQSEVQDVARDVVLQSVATRCAVIRCAVIRCVVIRCAVIRCVRVAVDRCVENPDATVDRHHQAPMVHPSDAQDDDPDIAPAGRQNPVADQNEVVPDASRFSVPSPA
jgi:hypothetical protein